MCTLLTKKEMAALKRASNLNRKQVKTHTMYLKGKVKYHHHEVYILVTNLYGFHEISNEHSCVNRLAQNCLHLLAQFPNIFKAFELMSLFLF